MGINTTRDDGSRPDITPRVTARRKGWFPGPDLWPALLLAIFFAIAVGAAIPEDFETVTRLICAWDAFILVMLVAMWWIISHSSADRSRLRANADDPGIGIILIASMVGGIAGLAGAVFLIGQPDPAMTLINIWLEPLVVTIAVAGGWLLLQSAYALHYAKLYYLEDDAPGGLQFEGAPPDDFDFAYFAFSVGMTFQVSDVVVTSREMRRVVLGQAVISFVYNLAIFALVINVIASKI
jgi:uncharacterized membrane protein